MTEENFVKLYGNLLMHSSLWLECWQARLVFVGMLALADREGRVNRPSVRVLARDMNLDVEDVQRGLAVLEAPDHESRSPAEEGRRLLRDATGWLVVNHAKYRELRTRSQRLASERSKRYRERDGRDASRSERDFVTPNRDEQRASRQVSVLCDLSSSDSSLLSEISERAHAEIGGHRWPGPPPPELEDAWTADRQRLVFAAAFETSQHTIANLGGKHVGSFHADVVKTAELQGSDPEKLFVDTLQRWLDAGLSKAAQGYPYACFQSDWGRLTAKGKTSLPGAFSAPETVASLRAAAREALTREDMAEVTRLTGRIKELENADQGGWRRGPR